MRERDALDDSLKAIGRIEQELDDQPTLIELGEAEKDDKTIAEAEAALKRLKAEVARRELEALLSGEADANDCYLEVHAGAGGTESQDWAGMLMRMYVRWAEAHGYKVDWLEESEGEGAGIKSATVQIKGHNAYGWLKSENGVHRLVRISPFDSNARRHTSFASVVVFPVVDDRIKIEINEADVRTDVMRSGGAGGGTARVSVGGSSDTSVIGVGTIAGLPTGRGPCPMSVMPTSRAISRLVALLLARYRLMWMQSNPCRCANCRKIA